MIYLPIKVCIPVIGGMCYLNYRLACYGGTRCDDCFIRFKCFTTRSHSLARWIYEESQSIRITPYEAKEHFELVQNARGWIDWKDSKYVVPDALSKVINKARMPDDL